MIIIITKRSRVRFEIVMREQKEHKKKKKKLQSRQYNCTIYKYIVL